MWNWEYGHVRGFGATCMKAALPALALLFCSPTQAFQLLTEEEYKQELSAPEPPRLEIRLRGKPNAPTIQVLAPPLDQVLRSPLRIELRFIPADGSDIDLESLQVLYGRLRLDITERILRYAKLSREGLLADKAVVPPGSHRFLIRIADTLQHLAEREFAVTVQSPEKK